MGLDGSLKDIITKYRDSFSKKIYCQENDDHDLWMDVFGISPELKRENRQYWGRELGMCWQLFVIEVFRQTRSDFGPALRFGDDEPCDFTFGTIAVDTKYRIGSGDSGTLKKFKSYGLLLRKEGYEPVFLIVREDNLPAAITACHAGKWRTLTGDATYRFIYDMTKFDVKEWLTQNFRSYEIFR